jgi:hypothetical protein
MFNIQAVTTKNIIWAAIPFSSCIIHLDIYLLTHHSITSINTYFVLGITAIILKSLNYINLEGKGNGLYIYDL